ncbi:K Homology domain-containing protein [Cynara cardunculus var. scolymus]|uniref:K Homology domain-containing protein n=1 Tax=Cynara cardunculus var. scolymus TaxID=59895 RepID=A0A103Y716_CYNCS|nr:K Homology domain-containing protein [Cynara cardunculus var. scolymus]
MMIKAGVCGLFPFHLKAMSDFWNEVMDTSPISSPRIGLMPSSLMAPSSASKPPYSGKQLSYVEPIWPEFEILTCSIPFFSMHLDQPRCRKILRVSEMIANQGLNDFDRLQLGIPNPSNPLNMMPDVAAISVGRWDGDSGQSPLQYEGFGGQQGLSIDHQNAAPASPSSLLTKRLLRLDVPVDIFPNFNFIGRLLGPRGNSLKRVEALTGCRVFIRGRGSIRDPNKAESPASIVDAQLRQAQEVIEELLKPVLRELAILNALFREDSSQPSSSSGSRRSNTMKRATTP